MADTCGFLADSPRHTEKAQNGRAEIGELPEDGPAQVGPVPLPPGRRHHAEDSEQLVAWVTEEPMTDSGLAWLALSAMHAQTGLVPVLFLNQAFRRGPNPLFGPRAMSACQAAAAQPGPRGEPRPAGPPRRW